MTSKLTRERIEWLNYAATGLAANGTEMVMSPQDVIALTECCLAAMDSEPVAWTWHHLKQWHVTNDEERVRDLVWDGVKVEPLYRHAQPAPETEREPIAWLNDAYLARGVVDGEAGSEDAGPGYIPVYREAGPQPAPVVPEKAVVGEMPFLGVSEGGYVRGWNDCRAAMLQELQKSAGASNNCKSNEKVQDKSRCGTKAAPELGSLPKNVESRCSNSTAKDADAVKRLTITLPDTGSKHSGAVPEKRRYSFQWLIAAG